MPQPASAPPAAGKSDTPNAPWINDDLLDVLEREERSYQARAHFPHLAPDVPPKESDEYPTFWED